MLRERHGQITPEEVFQLKLHRLNEKCMARTLAGTRCNNGGSQRHADNFHRYAICGQHADMLVAGKDVTFVTHITAENVADAVNQATLPGLDNNVATARQILQDTNPEGGYDCEIFYVSKLEPGKVLVMHKEIIHITHWAKSIILKEAVDRMPNIEGRVTGIMIRSGNQKAVFNRKPNGWVERPVPTNLSIVTNNNNA